MARVGRFSPRGGYIGDVPRRTRPVVGARGLAAGGSILLAVARLVVFVAALVAAVIAAAIVLRVLGANAHNSVVRDLHDAAKALVGPFDGIFKIRRPKVAITVNWGLAAVIYLIAGAIVSRFLRRIAPI